MVKTDFLAEILNAENIAYSAMKEKAILFRKEVLDPFCQKTGTSFNAWYDGEKFRFVFHAKGGISITSEILKELNEISYILNTETYVGTFCKFCLFYDQ
jgi:hypothetical protein